MKYVLDSSTGFKTLIPEALSDKAELLLQDYKNGIHELLSPDIYPVEVIHALTKSTVSYSSAWSTDLADYTDERRIRLKAPAPPRISLRRRHQHAEPRLSEIPISSESVSQAEFLHHRERDGVPFGNESG